MSQQALESVLGDLPDNVTEQEREHLHALKDFIQTGDDTGLKRISEKSLRLLRVKFSNWSGPRFKSVDVRYLPPEQLLGAMDLRLRHFDSKSSKAEKRLYIGVTPGVTPVASPVDHQCTAVAARSISAHSIVSTSKCEPSRMTTCNRKNGPTTSS